MDTPLKMLGELRWLDWLAMAFFFGGWIGYAVFARRRAETTPSLLVSTNRIRREWMLQSTWRENRVIDGIVVQSLSSTPSFFASTTILIIGGLLAVLSATERASELVREIPFAALTSVLVFDFKLLLLTAVFVYAFFRFTWSVRQYGFGALLVASAPDAEQFLAAGEGADTQRQAFADRAGRVMALAAETFNDGLRSYYMAFAAVAWLFSAPAFVIATAIVVFVLYRREFHSEMLQTVSGAPPRNPVP
jgi:uncharacterized membrane protein